MLRSSGPYTSAVYHPLDAKAQEIRLLVLETSTAEQSVYCSLHVVSLLSDPKPQYETVSYAWGDTSLRSTIFVSGRSKNVPAGPGRVLQRMRLATKSRVLWIDAICIDQDNLSERDQQVSIMPQIYSNTRRNLVWLGEDDGFTECALSSMALILERLRQDTDDYAILEFYLFNHNSRTRKRAQSPTDLEIDEGALVNFFDSGWFSRLWTVQEVTLAPRSTCFRGNYDVPFEDILRVCGWIHYQSNFLPKLRNARNRERLIELLTWAGPDHAYTSYINRRPEVSHLLTSMTGFRCEDPKDHVFGILGLYEKYIGAVPPSIAPDYHASVVDVFLRATRSAMHNGRHLGILSQISHRRGENRIGFPTWVPQLDREWDRERDPSRLRLRCDASGGTSIHIHESGSSNDKQLSLGGKILPGSVKEVVAAPNWDESSVDQFIHFLEMVEQIAQNDLARLAMVLSPGHTSQDVGILSEPECTEHFLAFKRYLKANRALPDYNHDSALHLHDRLAADYHLAFSNACRNRCFFTTDAGHLGIGPQTMEEGDTIAILYGCWFPVIVRYSESYSGSYNLIGSAYVHGIMDGEVVEDCGSEGWESDFIRLR